MLFNTLANLRVLIGLDPPRAQAMLDRLIGFLRATLDASRSGSHSLAGEFARLADYLALMKIRMGDRLQAELRLPPELAELPVPPLLLQPLVENAVRHGVEPSPEGGVIRIRTRVKLGRAVISIANSVPDEASRPGSGMALKNVKERLRLLHDVAAQFETRRDFDVFRVQIVVPL
jgi:two-component system sensor histidine kinase AlgZ